MYVRVDVDLEEVFDNCDADDVAKYFIRMKGWETAIADAEKSKPKQQPADFDSDFKAMIEAYKRGLPIDQQLSYLADKYYGLIV